MTADNTFRHPHEILSAQNIITLRNNTEDNKFFTNVHFLVDFGPWNAGEFAKHIALDYHTHVMRQLTNGGHCIRTCNLEIQHRMLRPERDMPTGRAQSKTPALSKAYDEWLHRTAAGQEASATLLPKEGDIRHTTDHGRQVFCRGRWLPANKHSGIPIQHNTPVQATDPIGTTDTSDMPRPQPQPSHPHKLEVDWVIENIWKVWTHAGTKQIVEWLQELKRLRELHADDTDVLPDCGNVPDKITVDYGLIDLTAIRKRWEEANQTTMDLINGYAAAITNVKLTPWPPSSPARLPSLSTPLASPPVSTGKYVDLLSPNGYDESCLHAGTLLESRGTSNTFTARDAMIVGRYLGPEIEPSEHTLQHSRYIYVIRTMVWGNIVRMNAKEIQDHFRVTDQLWPKSLMPGWSLLRTNEPLAPMEHSF